ncbi:MAG: DUF4340 domain-containing protein [Ruminococcaceae bacterium]|nr:DUF4340 domain-containing protein [Oscillospiraceae bacterium]
MTRNLKTILFMLAGVLVLVAALIALSCDGCGGEEPLIGIPGDTTSDSTVSAGDHGGVHIHENETGELLVDCDELETLRLISEQGDYLIRRGSDGRLTIDSLSGLLLEEDFLDVVWSNSLSFGYTYTLHSDEGINLADYGLDPAALTIECKYTDGTTCRLFVGDHISNSPNIYYFRFEGRDEVFINEFDISYFQGDYFWLSDDIFGDDVEDVTIGTIKLSGSAFPKPLTLEPNKAADKSDPYYGSKYIITSPFRGAIDDYLVTLLTDELTELVADDAVCVNPTDEQLAQYGLDKPFAVINHQRNGEWKTLRVSRTEQSEFYAKADGVDCVFLLSIDTFPQITSLTSEYLRTPEVHVRYFDAMHSIHVQSGDTDITFRLDRVPMETDNSLFEYFAYCGDTKLTLSNYKALLEVFNRATAVSYGGSRESDTPAMTVTITFFDGLERQREVISYYPAGTRRYLVEVDGSGDAVVGQMWVDKFLQSVQALSRNETVTP